MITLAPPSTALSLLSDELASWSSPESETAYRLETEAQRPVIDVPQPTHDPMAKVITLVSRLRSPQMQSQMQLQVAHLAA